MAVQAAKTKAKDSVSAGLNALGFAKPPPKHALLSPCLAGLIHR